MKNIIRLTFIVSLSIAISTLFEARYGKLILTTLYMVSSTMFSIGLCLIMSFNLLKVKNKSILRRIRVELKNIRGSFIFYYLLATSSLILNQYLHIDYFTLTILKISLRINFTVLFTNVILFSIFLFIVNFLLLEKLNNDVIDIINKEE